MAPDTFVKVESNNFDISNGRDTYTVTNDLDSEVDEVTYKNIAALSIRERDTSILSQAKQNIATNLANKNVEVKSDRTIIQHSFVNDENVKIRVPETDVSNIVRSYVNQNKPKKTARYVEDQIKKEAGEELEL